MVDFSWAQSRCATKITTVHDIPRHIDRRRHPIVGLLHGVKTSKVVQKTVFVSQVVQPLPAPVTSSTIEINRAKESRSRLPAARERAFLRPASSKRVCNAPTSTLGAKLLNLSRFSTQAASVVIEANWDKTGLSTETRIPVETNLMSNVSLKVPRPEKCQVSLSQCPHGF